jgi:hypothetical protein
LDRGPDRPETALRAGRLSSGWSAKRINATDRARRFAHPGAVLAGIILLIGAVVRIRRPMLTRSAWGLSAAAWP